MLRDEGKDDDLSEAIVFAAWQRVAGEDLRQHAIAFRLYRKLLIVAVADERWKQQLETLCGQMLFKLNAALGRPAITMIELRIDAETVDRARDSLRREQRSRMEQERTAMQNVPENVRAAADGIENDNLRRAFLLAAGSCLERRKNLKR